jgi:hypothetical protein
MDLQAGHVYRLAEAPPECAPASRNSSEASGVPLQWRDLLLEDTQQGAPVVQTRIRTLCGVGVKRCRQDADCGDQKCVHGPQNQWGFCGIEPAQ